MVTPGPTGGVGGASGTFSVNTRIWKPRAAHWAANTAAYSAGPSETVGRER